MKILTNSEGKAYLSQNGKALKKNEPTLIIKTITANGDYNATDDNADGYSEVSVNVPAPNGIIFEEVDANGYPLVVRWSSSFSQLRYPYGLFHGRAGYLYEKMTKFIFPENFSCDIAQGTFGYCDNLRSIENMPKTRILDETFRDCDNFSITELPGGIEEIRGRAFMQCKHLIDNLIIPNTVTRIITASFWNCGLKTVTFEGKPTQLDGDIFTQNTLLTDIYCPWSEGEVANAPWGATNATIHYNYTPS